MKTEIITYVVGPIITLFAGWFGSKKWDKHVQRKENMNALQVQEKEINNLYIKIVEIRKAGRVKIKEIETYYENELSNIRQLVSDQSDKLSHYRDNCNCPDDESN